MGHRASLLRAILPLARRWASAPLHLLAVLGAVTLVALVMPAKAVPAEMGVVTDLTWGASPGDEDRTVSVLRDSGASWVRLNANWADAEPAPGVYSSEWFGRYDRAVQLARSAGAKIVMLSYRSPAWASGSSNPETPPGNPEDFARFMRHLAARYAGKVQAYEVWNEPNLDRFWSTGSDAVAYTRLLQATYPAIKQADPGAEVVFGGLSTNDYDFLEHAYDAGAKGYFDVMSVHPYACANAPDVIAPNSDGRMTRDSFPAYREVRASMLARDDDKPIWFTEFGWSTTTQSCGVSEAQQAEYLTNALRFVEQDPYVQVALWYSLRNNFWDNDADTGESQFGLLRTDFSTKPAYAAFSSYTAPVTQTLTAVDVGTESSGGGGSTAASAPQSPPAPPPLKLRLKLGSGKAQRVRHLAVFAVGDRDCSIRASARISVDRTRRVFRTKKVARTLRAARQGKLRLKFSKRATRAIRRLLARGKRVKAEVKVVGRGHDGSRSHSARTLQLKR